MFECYACFTLSSVPLKLTQVNMTSEVNLGVALKIPEEGTKREHSKRENRNDGDVSSDGAGDGIGPNAGR